MMRYICLLSIVLINWSCSSKKSNTLKVVATPVPQAQMLEYIKPALKAEGIDLEIMITNDYNMPNRALAHKEIDANFFQHIPFLEEQIKIFHYPLVDFAKIEIEPMGLYSKKIRKISALREKATIAIPSDITNEARALLLLQKHGLIQLKDAADLRSTVVDIVKNPKDLQFLEVSAAMLPRSLDDVDAAVINANYALEAKLSPLKDALLLENPHDSLYVNILVIRQDEEERPDLQALKRQMTSGKMREFILNTYKGAVIPAF
jgi:D-methionine transport system substrate-binding protein